MKVGTNIPRSNYLGVKSQSREPVDGVNCLKIYVKFFIGVIAIENGRFEKQLMSQIDENDQLEVEKVERYLDLVKLYKNEFVYF